MQSGVSSALAVLASLILLSARDLVVAQITAPDCTVSTYEWSFNSIGQSPCMVTGYMLGTCNGGVFRVFPLLNTSFSYLGPPESQASNLCFCNTVALNLFSACSACQGGSLRTWSDYSQNCTKPLEPSTFPNPVPPETRVPRWALQDVTLVNLWNATEALIIGDTPEILPGELIGTSTSSTSSSIPSSTSPVSSSPVSTSSGSGSNTGAIAGGVAGGVIAIGAIAGLVFIFWRRRRRAQAPSAAFVVNDMSPPPSTSQTSKVHSAQSFDHTPGPLMALYDPNDPATYPRHQGTSTPTQGANVPFLSYNEYTNGNNNPTNLQPLRPQGYHGLPTV